MNLSTFAHKKSHAAIICQACFHQALFVLRYALWINCSLWGRLYEEVLYFPKWNCFHLFFSSQNKNWTLLEGKTVLVSLHCIRVWIHRRACEESNNMDVPQEATSFRSTLHSAPLQKLSKGTKVCVQLRDDIETGTKKFHQSQAFGNSGCSLNLPCFWTKVKPTQECCCRNVVLECLDCRYLAVPYRIVFCTYDGVISLVILPSFTSERECHLCQWHLWICSSQNLLWSNKKLVCSNYRFWSWVKWWKNSTNLDWGDKSPCPIKCSFLFSDVKCLSGVAVWKIKRDEFRSSLHGVLLVSWVFCFHFMTGVGGKNSCAVHPMWSFTGNERSGKVIVLGVLFSANLEQSSFFLALVVNDVSIYIFRTWMKQKQSCEAICLGNKCDRNNVLALWWFFELLMFLGKLLFIVGRVVIISPTKLTMETCIALKLTPSTNSWTYCERKKIHGAVCKLLIWKCQIRMLFIWCSSSELHNMWQVDKLFEKPFCGCDLLLFLMDHTHCHFCCDTSGFIFSCWCSFGLQLQGGCAW